MANKYVRSGASGSGTGADWTNAYTTLTAALSAATIGDNVFVSEDHSESTASAVTITKGSASSAPTYVICVNHSGSVPPVSADLRTSAVVATSGNNGLAVQGSLYIYGVTFNAGTGAVTVGVSTAGTVHLVNCALNKLGTSASTSGVALTSAAQSDQALIMENTTLSFGATGDAIRVGSGYVEWRDTASAITGSTFPTTLLGGAATVGPLCRFRGVDLSALGSSTTLLGQIAASRKFLLENCKLNASVVRYAAQTSPADVELLLVRSGSGTGNTAQEKYAYTGTQIDELTIVRSGGASDGTTSLAWKITTNAGANKAFPFDAFPIILWNETLSAITVTVQGIWGGGSVPNNDDIWIDVNYLGDSASQREYVATSNKADILASSTALSAGSGTWGGSTTKFAMAVTITPARKGPITVNIRAAKASSTFYIDPKPVIT